MSDKVPAVTFDFNLGDRARDKLSGLVGIVTSRADHFTGCKRYWLTPQELKDGKPVDGLWVDDELCELVEAGVLKPKPIATSGPIGQPSSAPRMPRP
jgi:hypothetical protein